MWHFINVILAITLPNLVGASEVINAENDYDTSTLEMVHVLFRHGNRTPDDLWDMYPKDPYRNETFYPYGLGQLTNKGKMKAYLVGKALRSRYDKFLGSSYVPTEMEAVCTEFPRTKMTLQLVLAGLYPPSGTVWEWNQDLNWQPIPFSYKPFTDDDHLLSMSFMFCPKYSKLYKDYLNSSSGIELQKKYVKLFKYLSEYAGAKGGSFFNILAISSTLAAEEDFGLKLPSWTDEVYPQLMDEAPGDVFYSFTATPEMKQINGGFLLKKIIGDTRAKIQNTLVPESLKLFLYSAHDVNVVNLLSAMELFDPHQPPYSAYVLVEVHKLDNTYGIKVFYQDYAQPEPRLLKVPGCDYFCPFEEFVKLLQKNLPKGDNPCEDDLR